MNEKYEGVQMAAGAIGGYPNRPFGNNGPTTAPEAPPVHRALQFLEKAHASLHDRIGALYARLEPILAPQPQQPVGNEAMSNRASIAGQIESEARAAMSATERIEGLLNRLEV